MPEMSVKDVMSSRVVTCSISTKVSEAAKLMRDNDVGSVVICDGKKPIGIVTREDITNKVAADDKKPSTILVKEIMTSPVVTVSPEDDLSKAVKEMTKYGYERMPVKSLGKLVGFVSVRDVLRVSPGLIDMMAEHLKKEEAEGEDEDKGEEEATSGECELCGNFQEELTLVNDKWVCDTCKEEASEL